MKTKESMKKYTQSFERFTNIDGNNYGGAIWSKDCDLFYLEGRVNKKTGTMSIIQYWPNGDGYHIYVDESLLIPATS